MSADEFDPTDDTPTPEDGEARPAVFVTTREPVTVSIAQLDDPRAPDSSALAAYIDGRMVARSAMPAEAIARLIELRLFDEPVPLGLFAYEEAPGLQCRLFALVPRSLLEAAAHGRCIVTTQTPGCALFTRNDVEGLVVPPADVEALAQAFVTLAADPQRVARYGKAARERIFEGFTTKAVAEKFVGLYDAMMRA